MKKIISFTTAVNIALMQYGAITIFHLCIILGILLFNFAPIDYLWGGRMETKEELLNFEIVSFLVMIFCIFITLVKGEYIKVAKLKLIANIFIWLLVILFTLNTVGNILAKTNFEKMFSVVTALLAFLNLRIGLGKEEDTK